MGSFVSILNPSLAGHEEMHVNGAVYATSVSPTSSCI
jgi:hypothetical protein